MCVSYVLCTQPSMVSNQLPNSFNWAEICHFENNLNINTYHICMSIYFFCRCRLPAGAGRCRPVPGRASEGAPGGRPVPVAGRCRPVPGRASEGAPGGRPVPVAGRCRPVPGCASEGAPGGRPVPVAGRPVPVGGRCRLPAGAGRCRPVPGLYIPRDRPGPFASRCRWPRPVPVAGRCRLPAGAGWES